MADNTITYTLTARDLSGPTLEQNRQAVERLVGATVRHDDAMRRSAISAQAMQRQYQRMTTAAGLQYEALQRVNAALSGLVIGGTIGIAITAMSGLTQKIYDHVAAWFSAEAALKKYREQLGELEKEQRKDLETFRAQQLQLYDQIEQQQRYVNLLRERGAAQQFIDGELRRLKDLQREYNAILQSIDAVERSLKQAAAPERPETKRPKEPDDFGIDKMRSLDLQRQREEEENIAKWREEERRAEIDRAREADQEILNNSRDFVARRMDIMQEDRANAELLRQQELASERNRLVVTGYILSSLASLANSKSRAMFRIAQVAALSQAAMDATRALNTVWADPLIPTYKKPYWVAAIAAATAANVATIAGMSFGGGARGSGGGGVPSTAATTQTTAQTPTILVLRFEGSDAVTDTLANSLVEPLVKQLGERNGSSGGYQVQIERRQ